MNIEQTEKILLDFVQGIIDKISSAEYKVKVSSLAVKSKDKQDEYILFNIEVEGDDVELLIGYHGKNLKALTTIVINYLNRKFPEDRFKINRI